MSWYVTNHPGQLGLLSLSVEWGMGTRQVVVAAGMVSIGLMSHRWYITDYYVHLQT